MSFKTVIGRGKHIVFVDDEPDIATLVFFRLQHEGYKVTIAKSGQEALNRVSQKSHLILLDVVLPDIDGFEVCKRIKSNEKLKDIPIIFFTAEGCEIDTLVEKIKKAGGQGYIIKPFSSKELLNEIQKYI